MKHAFSSGNKKDLRESREVTEQEGNHLAAKYRCPYYESSALFDDNISPIFQVSGLVKSRQDIILKL